MSTHRPRRFYASAAALTTVLALSGGVLTACNTNTPVGAVASSSMHDGMNHRPVVKPSRQTVLYSNMRTLWDQHMQWTYDAIVAFASGSPGLDATIGRLLQNQVDIGNAVVPFYGKAAAQQLTDLLQTHIKEAVPVLQAAKAGDKAALDAAVTAWYANAAEIGQFLAKANPNWARADMPEMMKTHITQTIGYATDVLTGDYAKAIADYDQAQAHMDQMADMLSAGLVAQFPRKF
ncbi:MAG: hypothetical protein JST64_10295 [Actinobacteria bacterium]|nr:hypothetical protein [Actinomycetota bacterium]